MQVFSCLALSVPVGVRAGFARLISPHCGCVYFKDSSLAIFLEVMTRRGFLSMPGHRHCRPCCASSPFFGHSPFHRW